VPWDSLDIDGAVVVEPCAADELTGALLERGVAVVCLGRQPDAELPHVDLRGPATAELLLDHLHRQGARRIGLLVGETARHSYLAAREAYQRFTREHGLPALVVDAPESAGEQAGYQACRRLLDADPKLDAVCAMVDAFAVGALRALAEAGRRVPEDVLVVTRYDGVRARTSAPALTAVDLHLGEVASAAVQLLLAHIAGDDVGQVVVGPAPSLVVRASSLRGPLS
jgi:DNA-binding LacI/PurR family transcriptional regulator